MCLRREEKNVPAPRLSNGMISSVHMLEGLECYFQLIESCMYVLWHGILLFLDWASLVTLII